FFATSPLSSSSPFHLPFRPSSTLSLRRFEEEYSSKYSPLPEPNESLLSFTSSFLFSPEPDSLETLALLSSLTFRSFKVDSFSESEYSLASLELCLLDLWRELRGIAGKYSIR